ncbi:MAG: T9SS type A sorting domain-containing protein [bacterium]
MPNNFISYFIKIFFFPVAFIPAYSQLYVLENDFIKREVRVDQQKLSTVSLENKLTGRSFAVESQEFLLKFQGGGILTNQDFQVQNADELALEDGGQEITVNLSNIAQSIQITVNYELLNSDFFTRKWIIIKSISDSAGVLEAVEVERFKISGAELVYSGYGAEGVGNFVSYPITQQYYLGLDFNPTGFYTIQPYQDLPNDNPLGQPVVMSDFFLGLEYPAGYNCVYNGREIFLRHFPGCSLKKDQEITSKKSVIGVGEHGNVRINFIKYIVSLKGSHRFPRPYLNFNNWWYGPSSPDGKLDSATAAFKQCLCDAHDVHVEAFVLDDGWQANDSWTARRDNFPDGLGPIKNMCDKTQSKLGLWLHLNKGALCLAFPPRTGYFKNLLKNYVNTYNVGHYKFDFHNYFCDRSNCGHLPGMPYCTEAITNAEIEIIESIREGDSTVNIDYHEGWLSPWWLMYLDALFTLNSTGGDKALGADRDSCIRHSLKQYPYFPMWARDPHGILVTSASKAPDEFMRVVGRGTFLWTVYFRWGLPPQASDTAVWSSWARTIKWGLKNKDVLFNTKAILGRAKAGEVIGYSHFNHQKGIISLENYGSSPQQAAFCLDESIGCSIKNQQLTFEVFYPPGDPTSGIYQYGDTVKFTASGLHILELNSTSASIKPVQYFFNNDVALHAFPNPFSNKTAISCELLAASTQQISLSIYDIKGKLIWSKPFTSHLSPNTCTSKMCLWDGKDNHGHTVAPGNYFVNINSGDNNLTRRITLVK